MIRRGLTIAGLALAVLMTACAAAADAPSGPRLAVVRASERAAPVLLSVAADGGSRHVLSGGSARKPLGVPAPMQAPSWPASGEKVVFSGYNRQGKLVLLMASSDGTDRRVLPRTRGASYPVLSPDGRTLAFARDRFVRPQFDPEDPVGSLEGGYASITTWVRDLTDGSERRLTKWRNDLYNTPSSFSPDGSFLAVSSSDRGKKRAVAISFTRAPDVVLARDAEAPVYSPDGSSIAFVSYRDGHTVPWLDERDPVGELYLRSTGDGAIRRLTFTPEQEERTPSWDPSGQRIAYTQSADSNRQSSDMTDVVMQLNADGSCAERILGPPVGGVEDRRVGFFGPVWQPGPGREAGPISC